MEFKHYSVMSEEIIRALKINPDGIYVDATFGGGGHSLEILKQISAVNGKGKVIGIDQDIDALNNAKEKFREYIDTEKLLLVKSNFVNINDIIKNLGYSHIDGALIDLGISSYQIDNKDKGFSYMQNSPLDMRMDKDRELDAKFVVNCFEQKKLKEILYTYGEEKYSDIIVKNIIAYREKKEIETTGELVEIIASSVKKFKYDGGHPAKRTFQALRIYVNDELSVIEPTLTAMVNLLSEQSRIAVLTFHSLEDRIVKRTFVEMAKNCICPHEFPICVCNKKQTVRLVEKKPILPSEKEINENSRSKSAKLRIAERV